MAVWDTYAKPINNIKNLILMRHLCLLLSLLFFSISGNCVVKYDEGRVQINGIQLLQDRENPQEYYYLPQFPKISEKEDGSLELLCLKYVGKDGTAGGGIFHALIEFDLPDDVLASLQEELEKITPGAKIAGPVPLKQTLKDGEDGLAGFQVISSILNNTEGENPFTETVLTSGHAPLLPGSKAAIAAKLSEEGATLLWESLQGPTSDVSVAISGYYEAAVKGYNAIVKAEMSTVYEHYSRIINKAEGYDRTHLRKVSDEMLQEQILDIDVFDRSEGLGIKTDDMQAILDMVTDKLIELMFDSQAGWAKLPEKEKYEEKYIPNRQPRGFFSTVFGGAQNDKYVTDNQFILKRKEDIKTNRFYLNLSKSTTIKVPIYTSGNIGGAFFNALSPDEKYFRIVNLEDADFQHRDVHFQVDGTFAESFGDILNFVSVNFRKTYNGFDTVTKDSTFRANDLEKGNNTKNLSYPRLGEDESWLNYEYRLNWSMKGSNKMISIPANPDEWLKSSEPAISLIPPFGKRKLTIDADRTQMQESGIHSATVRFFVILDGKPQLQRTLILKSTDAESTEDIALYHDPGEPVAYQVTWYGKDLDNGKMKEQEAELTDEYLFLLPPSK